MNNLAYYSFYIITVSSGGREDVRRREVAEARWEGGGARVNCDKIIIIIVIFIIIIIVIIIIVVIFSPGAPQCCS